MTNGTTIKLGHTARDRITGFEGTVTGLVQYITGCNQALLAPKVDDKGAPRDAHWFDVQRLEVLPGHNRLVLDNVAAPGPDTPAPVR